MRNFLAATFLLLAISSASAEQACPKFRVGCVPLDTFACDNITRSSFISRVCHDEAKQYMIIWLRGVPYHYCGISAKTVAEFKSSPSMGVFYNENIRSKQTGEHGPFDCRYRPMPAY
jgi:hypothetical protein